MKNQQVAIREFWQDGYQEKCMNSTQILAQVTDNFSSYLSGWRPGVLLPGVFVFLLLRLPLGPLA